ncbi:calpain family cysteine protease [Podospora didyma]|uniref:Calpain family cysteine protease n=1 Tax=Podospora didyma TaxID=330526 RepID=A0AAE0NTM6_9PEZI|nr:calpain family cysteine protease [Podospora didyma]
MAAPPPPVDAIAKKKDTTKTPQELVSEFWDKFFAKKPGRVTSIFPRSLYATLLPPSQPRGASSARNAAESYEAAAKECREKVKRIIRECNRTNEKFTDPDFDIESDNNNNCLNGLVREDWSGLFSDSGDSTSVSAGQLKSSLDTLVDSNVLGPGGSVPLDPGVVRGYINDSNPFAFLFGEATRAAKTGGNVHGSLEAVQKALKSANGENGNSAKPKPRSSDRFKVSCGEWYDPGSIHRLDWIFDSPQFTVDGYAASDIKQGGNGDCWWLASVATIAHRKDLMDKVCVIRDEEIGVYGFVFYRDGEWISTVIDDNLYLTAADFDYYGDTYDSTGKRAREHKQRYQTGSEALYFAKCEDKNETWLPLLEKAYAKVHNDYEAISGGYPGEAVEDMTGGVTTTVASNRVLKKDKLWRELVNSDGEFVFALSALGTGWDWKKGGLALGHAYSILGATEEVGEEGEKVRLVRIRNPWGERASNGIGEWNGPWSDGSKEWTPYWLKKLNHKFGDDGIFWMSYKDVLDTFMFLHRTRLFDEKWTVVQQWASVNVGWVAGYLNTKFIVEVKKAGTVVIVLAQLDDRYFHGFEGQYQYSLHFLLQEVGTNEHICRVRPVHAWENRSVSCEVDLEPGIYEVLPKITATRWKGEKMVEDVVKEYAEKNPAKLRQVGMQYDLAHTKGGIPDEDELLTKKKAEEKKKADEKKKKEKEKAKRKKEKEKAKKARAKAKAKREKLKIVTNNNTTTTITTTITTEDNKPAEDKKDVKKAEGAVEDKSKSDEVTKPAEDTKEGEKKADDKPSTDSTAENTPTSSITSGDEPDPAEEVKKDSETKPEEKKEEQTKGEEAKVDEVVVDDESDDEESEEEEEEEEEEKKEDEPPVVDDDEDRTPWNAVCVIGLRVYARDPEVTVTLAEPKSAEEAASLVMDSKAVGATM